MDKLQSMSVFVRVVEQGSFTAAAETLRLSGTMIGLHIKGLEQHLGTRLLNRTTRRQSLTAFGQEYYQRCRQILADIDDAESAALNLQQSARGHLKVACPVSLGVHVLTPLLAQFLTQWPEVTVDLVLSDRALDMADEGIDVRIHIGPLEQMNSLVARPLPVYRSLVCASPAYLERAGVPASPHELQQHRCLGFAHPSAGHEWGFEQHGRAVKVPVNLVMAINNGEALRQAALKGLGIIMQPEVLLAQDVQAGKLRILLPDCTPPAKPVHILTFADRQQLPKIRLLVAFLLEQMQAGFQL